MPSGDIRPPPNGGGRTLGRAIARRLSLEGRRYHTVVGHPAVGGAPTCDQRDDAGCWQMVPIKTAVLGAPAQRGVTLWYSASRARALRHGGSVRRAKQGSLVVPRRSRAGR